MERGSATATAGAFRVCPAASGERAAGIRPLRIPASRGGSDAGTGESGRDRGRGGRMLRSLLARPARLGRRPAGRARRADERLDVPFRGARRPAALVAQPDEDDDGERRPLPLARGRGRPRDGLARGRLAAARLVGGAHGGDRPAGGLGEDVRAAARAGLGGRGAGALPADVDGRRARGGVPPDRRLHRPEPAHARARRGRAAPRRRGRDPHAGHGHRRRAAAASSASRRTGGGSRPRSSSTPAGCSPPSSALSRVSPCRSCRWRTSTSCSSRPACRSGCRRCAIRRSSSTSGRSPAA